MRTVPLTRTLPSVLRRELAQLRRNSARLFLAEIVDVPDAGHITVSYGGEETTVPRLGSYTSPSVGSAALCLTCGALVVALGENRSTLEEA